MKDHNCYFYENFLENKHFFPEQLNLDNTLYEDDVFSYSYQMVSSQSMSKFVTNYFMRNGCNKNLNLWWIKALKFYLKFLPSFPRLLKSYLLKIESKMQRNQLIYLKGKRSNTINNNIILVIIYFIDAFICDCTYF